MNVRTVHPFLGATLFSLLVLTGNGHAQNINLRDGKVIAGKNLRRDGVTIMTTVSIGSGSGEIGYAVAQIASIEFPEPPQLKEAASLIAAGKLQPALAATEQVVASQKPFRDIKGNFWGDAALQKFQILIALGREKEAEPLVQEMLALKQSSNAASAGTAAQGLLSARQGNAKQALTLSSGILSQQEGADPAILAIAYLAKGHAHLLLKEYTEAIFAYLHLPIFFPEQKTIMPSALLGSARCFAKLEANGESQAELDRAIRTLLEFHPDSPEAAAAKSEFPNVLSRIKESKP